MSLMFLFLASFFSVFLLGLNSQFVRDQMVGLAFVVSWGISTSQFTFTRVISQTSDPLTAFFVAGFGGSFGICASIYFYRWFFKRFENWRKGEGFNI